MLERFWLLCRLMAHEEWRLHSTLFNGKRFAMLPVVLMALTAAGAATLTAIGLDLALLGAGVIALAFLFGLQTGTIGFESRDGVDNVLGDATFLLFSVRTLPLSNRFVIAAFLVKDMAYYAILFIIPIVFGAFFGHELAVAFEATTATTGLTLSGIALLANLWVAATLVFLFGVSLSLVASGEVARNVKRGGIALLGGILVLLVAFGRAVLPDIDVVSTMLMPPFSLTQFVILAGATLAVSLVSMWRFAPTSDSGETMPRNEFAWVSRRFGDGSMAALVAKMVMDVHRSSGGIGKLVASSAILLAAVYVILEAIQQWLPLLVSPGIVFSVFLSVTAIPTYIWLNQLDDLSSYRFYPIEIRSLFTAKAYAFVLLETPVALAYYVFMAVVLQPHWIDMLVGGVVLIGTMTYLFGITVYLTGFEPNESLFDSVIFLKFTLAGMVVLVPFLMAGFFIPTVTLPIAGLLSGGALITGIVGLVAYHRGANNWTERLDYSG